MSHYNTLFGHLLTQLPRHQFENLVLRWEGDKYIKKFSTWNQLQVLLYAQCSGLQSLRDIETGFSAQASRLYHLGLPGKICRNTLSHANAERDWHIYQEFFYKLLARCKDLTPAHRFKFKNPLHSLDATTISLCVSVFPWAKIKYKKGAFKMHFQYDHDGDIPSFMTVTSGHFSDVIAAKRYFPISRDSIYCFDRAYVDYAWFRRLDDAGAYWVTRLKEGMKYDIVGQHASFKGKEAGVVRDHVIQLRTLRYQKWIRLVGYYDKERDEHFEFISNNLELSGRTIADIYKGRWQIEAFFRWIKQNLKIKTFLGTSENAVLTQVWVAMCYYLLLAYIKYKSRYNQSLYYLHRLIRSSLMMNLTIIDLFLLNERRLAKIRDDDLQLLFPF